MGYTYQSSLPSAEPVSLAELKTYLRLPVGFTTEDNLLSDLIQSAREDGERLSGLVLAQRTFTQVLDSFPYFTDTIQSQLAYPPSYYSLPRYSTTLWNYSQMIKLEKAPLISVDLLTYINASGAGVTLAADIDFIVDPETRLARIFPMVGQYWPPCLYTPNAVKIDFTAGYDPDPTKVKTFTLPSPPPNPPNQQSSYEIVVGIPQSLKRAVRNLAGIHFQARAGFATAQDIERAELAFQANGLMDFAPTRG